MTKRLLLNLLLFILLCKGVIAVNIVINYTDTTNNTASYVTGTSGFGTCTGTPISMTNQLGTTTAFSANNYTQVNSENAVMMTSYSSGSNVDVLQRYHLKVPLPVIVDLNYLNWMHIRYVGNKISCGGTGESMCGWIGNWSAYNTFVFSSAMSTTRSNYTQNYSTATSLQLINSTDGRVVLSFMCDQGDSGVDAVSTDYIQLLLNYDYFANFSSLTINDTSPVDVGDSITHSVNATSNAEIRGYIFSWNGSNSCDGVWVNSSVTSITPTMSYNLTNVSTVMSGCDGKQIGYRFFINTTNNGWNWSDVYNYNVTSVSDSCTYGGSGNWVINCADACNLSVNTNLLTNNIVFNGTGLINVSANLTNYTRATAQNSCRVRVYSAGSLRRR